MEPTLESSLFGCFLGAAIGDALGLPMEGLSRRRQLKMFPDISGYRLFFGKGFVSDDTEHLVLTGQALAASGGRPDLFGRALAWRMRSWLLGLPAGIGLATLRAGLKLCLGFPAGKSGVFSAGNGPAMRSAIIGAAFRDDPVRIKDLVRVSTRITHTAPKAERGALAVALAARLSSLGRSDPDAFLRDLKNSLGEDETEFFRLMEKAAASAIKKESATRFASELGQGSGIDGYIYHSVPAVIQAWLGRPADLRTGLENIIRAGGDSDTTASILGGILGAGLERGDFPEDLVRELWGWPVTVGLMEKLSRELARAAGSGLPGQGGRLPLWGMIPRNLVFMVIVLAHGFRRLLPPY
ncbi:MAG: ADP-ribosylglycohydrolase family protein [Pseudomonadota bacterium]